jgi:hypothetical protein
MSGNTSASRRRKTSFRANSKSSYETWRMESKPKHGSAFGQLKGARRTSGWRCCRPSSRLLG